MKANTFSQWYVLIKTNTKGWYCKREPNIEIYLKTDLTGQIIKAKKKYTNDLIIITINNIWKKK